MRRPLRVGTLLLALSLGGCATLQTPPAADAPAVAAAWDSRQRQLSATQGFDATGRIAVKGGGLSGSLAWQQEGERFSLRVAGPFGAGALSMEGTPDLVTLKGKDLDLTTSDPQTVLAERTGWRLPLAALRWWVLGLPAPAPYTALRLDAEGRPESFEQDGWRLSYPAYAAQGSGAMPARIEATRGEWMAIVVLHSLVTRP